MQIEDLKRWHWIAAGIVVGLVFAYVWQGVEAPSVRNTSAAEFLRDVTLKDPTTGRPIVRNIVVRPPEPNFEADELTRRIARLEAEALAAEQAAKSPPPDAKDRAAFARQKQDEAQAARAAADTARDQLARSRVNVVTYKKWMKERNSEKRVLIERQFIAEIPFVPTGQRNANVDPGYTVVEHLKQMQQQYPHITFNTGWWTTKPATYAIWTIGSVIVIGGLWPTLLNAVIGAGYGRKREPRPKAQPQYDLSRYGGDGHAEPAAPARPAVSEVDQQRLREMTEQLETRLGGFGQVEPPPPSAASAPDPAPVRKLDGGPLELAPMQTPEADNDIEVKGEYYPVLIRHKKQPSESETDEPPKQG